MGLGLKKRKENAKSRPSYEWVQNGFKVYGLIRVIAEGAQWQHLKLLWPHTYNSLIAITLMTKKWTRRGLTRITNDELEKD